MTDRGLFGIAVRVVGLWLAAYEGLVNLFAGIATLADLQKTGNYTPEHRFIVGTMALILGILLIKGEWVVKFAYGSGSRDPR